MFSGLLRVGHGRDSSIWCQSCQRPQPGKDCISVDESKSEVMAMIVFGDFTYIDYLAELTGLENFDSSCLGR